MITVSRKGSIPIYQQIYEQIRNSILSGSMPENFRLPSIRALAGELRVARNTVESAYGQLVLEGYITSVPGSGCVVNKIDAEPCPMPEAGRAKPPESGRTAGAPEAKYSFQYGVLGAEYFPVKLWKKYTAELLEAPDAQSVHSLCDVRGDESLREEIRRYLYRSRGVRCGAEQIIVCGGTQAALEAVLRVLPRAGAAAMENPCYDGARAVFENSGVRILPVPVGKNGIDIQRLAGTDAPLAYISPSHQFPTGAVMPIHNRLELLSMARRKNMTIIEDDYDSEYRYNGQPVPSLQSIDSYGQVVYAGTFSKVLSAGLRTAYFVLPRQLLQTYLRKFSGYTCAVPLLEQKILARFMADGHWEKQLRRICTAHKKKHDLLVAALERSMGGRVRISGQNAGLHLLLEFPDGRSESDLLRQAMLQGVRVFPTSPFWLSRDSRRNSAVLLGYGRISADDIVPAVDRLKKAWFGG